MVVTLPSKGSTGTSKVRGRCLVHDPYAFRKAFAWNVALQFLQQTSQLMTFFRIQTLDSTGWRHLDTILYVQVAKLLVFTPFGHAFSLEDMNITCLNQKRCLLLEDTSSSRRNHQGTSIQVTDFCRHTTNGFLERNFQLHGQIMAPPCKDGMRPLHQDKDQISGSRIGDDIHLSMQHNVFPRCHTLLNIHFHLMGFAGHIDRNVSFTSPV
mmetsp:Transcript_23437/g.54448  ORF Transcript_23437/g.54448 Transcript_23437/m.54448 type:complete len:210 (+) Transcript_23437:565-1194(+)